jgi:hypothetical protein
MTRMLSKYASEEVKKELNRLLRATDDPQAYRQAMFDLGVSLGSILQRKLKGSEKVFLACTAEDADFLAKGILDTLASKIKSQNMFFACFWNHRQRLGGADGVDIAPVIHRYVDPRLKPSVDVLIIVKSIISTSCVVRTNLEEVMQRTLPKSIFVVAPVMYKDAPSSLRKEFPKSISQKFQYLYFAKDSERTASGEVRPGIGGSVYELLGFRTHRQKDRYRPEILKEWLKKHMRVVTPR